MEEKEGKKEKEEVNGQEDTKKKSKDESIEKETLPVIEKSPRSSKKEAVEKEFPINHEGFR